MYSALFKNHYKIPFNFLRPGLEIKYACEESARLGAKTYFLGPELNQGTWQRLLHETRTTVYSYLVQNLKYWGHYNYQAEKADLITRLENSEADQFSEQCADPYVMNWYVQNMDIFFPRFKQIFVDKRDEDLFQAIDRCPERKIVVVVNQWHMEGIEHEWAARYGQMPRSVHFPEGVDPIGDMDLRDGLFQRLYNALHREIAAANTKAAPATYADWIIGYHRESNWQYEHRDM